MGSPEQQLYNICSTSGSACVFRICFGNAETILEKFHFGAAFVLQLHILFLVLQLTLKGHMLSRYHIQNLF